MASDRTLSDRTLIDATNAVFWKATGYKPGQRLDMRDPRDREMAKVWMRAYHQVSNLRAHAAEVARQARAATRSPYVLVIQSGENLWSTKTFETRDRLDVMYDWLVDEPRFYTYLAAFNLTRDNDAPTRDQFAATRAASAVSGWY